MRSTKCTDRQKALGVALEFERAAKLAKRGELVETQAREVLKSIMARADSGETIQTVSIAAYFRQWLENKETRKAVSTALRYKGVVEPFLESLGSPSQKPLTSLTGRDVDRFLDARRKAGAAAGYTHHEHETLRAAVGKLPPCTRRTPANVIDLLARVIHIRLTMKTATVRDLRNQFSRVAAWIAEGEPVEITKAGKLFARLVPPAPAKPHKLVKVDFEKQLRETWGDRVFSAKEVATMRAAELDGEEG